MPIPFDIDDPSESAKWKLPTQGESAVFAGGEKSRQRLGVSLQPSQCFGQCHTIGCVARKSVAFFSENGRRAFSE